MRCDIQLESSSNLAPQPANLEPIKSDDACKCPSKWRAAYGQEQACPTYPGVKSCAFSNKDIEVYYKASGSADGVIVPLLRIMLADIDCSLS